MNLSQAIDFVSWLAKHLHARAQRAILVNARSERHFQTRQTSFIMARCPSPLVYFISGFLPQPNLVWRNPVFAGDWPYTKTFIEGVVYYLELLLPYHVTANRTRFRVHHIARNQTKQQTIRNLQLKWELQVHAYMNMTTYRSISIFK